jgi:hypothetical protein
LTPETKTDAVDQGDQDPKKRDAPLSLQNLLRIESLSPLKKDEDKALRVSIEIA